MASTIDLSTETINKRMRELKDFDDTKAGVKGLIDSGTKTVPEIFIRPPEELEEEKKLKQFQARDFPEIPVINLQESRELVVEKVRDASGTWGFFQVVNHGIPETVLDRIIDGVKLFNDQDVEVKMKLYSRENNKLVRFVSNFDLFKSKYANWRDTLSFSREVSAAELHGVEGLPESTREAALDYMSHVEKLGTELLEILSEALGLEPNHLRSIGCCDAFGLACHYYPQCPKPELTLGTTRHTDFGILTLLLQSQVSALQVRYDGEWVNVDPIPGAIVINIGDLLQIISNDKFKSVEHRVLANSIGPRMSIAYFFTGYASVDPPKFFSPIKELTSENNPPKYREVLLSELISRFYSGSLEKSLRDYYKI